MYGYESLRKGLELFFEVEVEGQKMSFVQFVSTANAIKAIVIAEDGTPLIVNLHEMRFV